MKIEIASLNIEKMGGPSFLLIFNLDYSMLRKNKINVFKDKVLLKNMRKKMLCKHVNIKNKTLLKLLNWINAQTCYIKMKQEARNGRVRRRGGE